MQLALQSQKASNALLNLRPIDTWSWSAPLMYKTLISLTQPACPRCTKQAKFCYMSVTEISNILPAVMSKLTFQQDLDAFNTSAFCPLQRPQQRTKLASALVGSACS